VTVIFGRSRASSVRLPLMVSATKEDARSTRGRPGAFPVHGSGEGGAVTEVDRG